MELKSALGLLVSVLIAALILLPSDVKGSYGKLDYITVIKSGYLLWSLTFDSLTDTEKVGRHIS